MGAVLATERERLAWRPTGHELDTALKRLEVNRSDIALEELPTFDYIDAAILVAANGFATMLIPLDDFDGVES
jgi:hypothetical protein